MESIFRKVRQALFGTRPISPQRQSTVTNINAIRFAQFTNSAREDSSDLNQTPESSTPTFQETPSSNRDIVKILRKTQESCENLKKENQRLKAELEGRCSHREGVHYLLDPQVRASDIHRMNRARSAYFAPLSTEFVPIDRASRQSYEAAKRYVKEVGRTSKFLGDSEEERPPPPPPSQSVERKATQTEPIQEEEKQLKEDKREESDLFGSEERVIHSVSSEIKQPPKRKKSPYSRAFPASRFREPVERTQTDVVRAFHFLNSQEEVGEAPQTEPRAPNQGRLHHLLQTGDTSATKKLLESEQGERFQSDARQQSQAQVQTEEQDVIVIQSSEEQSQEAEQSQKSAPQFGMNEEDACQLVDDEDIQQCGENMLLAGVIPRQMRQDSEVSHRPSNFEQDFDFLSRGASEQTPSVTGANVFVHHEVVEIQTKPQFQEGMAEGRRKERHQVVIEEEEESGNVERGRRSAGENLMNCSIRAEYGDSRPASFAKRDLKGNSEEEDEEEQKEEDEEEEREETDPIEEVREEQVQGEGAEKEEPEKEEQQLERQEQEEDQAEFQVHSQSQEDGNKEHRSDEENSSDQEEQQQVVEDTEEQADQYRPMMIDSEQSGQGEQQSAADKTEEDEDNERRQEIKVVEEEKEQEQREVEEEQELEESSDDRIDLNPGFVEDFREQTNERTAERSSRHPHSSSSKRRSQHSNPTPQVQTNQRESRLKGRGPPRYPSPPPVRGYELRSKFGLKRVNYSPFY